MRSFFRRHSLPTYIAYAITLVGILFFSALAVQRHNAFLTTAFDLGNYDQAVWNTAHGRFFQLTNIADVSSRLAHHVEPILLFIAPLYWLWSDPRVLLIVQAGTVMAGALPAYWLAARRLDDRWAALAFPLAWILFPALEHALLFDFHAVTLAAGLLLFAFNWLDEGRTLPFLVAAVLAMWTKEEIGFIVAMMGLYAALVQRRWRLGLGTIVLGVGWVLIAFELIIPQYSPEGEHVFLNYYQGLGNGLSGLFITAIMRPDVILERAIDGGMLPYLWNLLTPVVFLPLLAPQVLLIAAPSFAVNLLSSFEPMRTLEGYHYPTPLVPFVTAGAIVGLATLKQWLSEHEVNGGEEERGKESEGLHSSIRPFVVSPGWVARGGAILIVIVSLVYHAGHGATPLAAGFEWPQVTEHHRIGEQIIDDIPPDAAVSAQWQLNPHVSERRRVYQYPDVRDADYVLLDVTIIPLQLHPNDLHSNVERMLAGDWGIAAANDGWLLLERGAEQTQLPDSFYDFARVPEPAPAVPLDVRFGNAIRLIGLTQEQTQDGVTTTYYWRREAGVFDNTALRPFYYDPATGHVLEDTSRRPLVATLWYPPEEWQPGETIQTQTLPWPVPEPYAIAVRVTVEDSPLSPTNFTVAPAVRYRPDRSVQVRTVGTDETKTVTVDGPWMLGQSEQVALVRARRPSDDSIVPGATYDVLLQWRASGPTDTPLSVFTQILNEDGTLVAQHDGPPADGLRPTTDWHAGEVIADLHSVELPADMPAGTYRLIVGLYDPETGDRLVTDRPDNAIELAEFQYGD